MSPSMQGLSYDVCIYERWEDMRYTLYYDWIYFFCWGENAAEVVLLVGWLVSLPQVSHGKEVRELLVISRLTKHLKSCRGRGGGGVHSEMRSGLWLVIRYSENQIVHSWLWRERERGRRSRIPLIVNLGWTRKMEETKVSEKRCRLASTGQLTKLSWS